MTFFSIFMISVALAMDAFAVSVTSGISIMELKIKDALKIAAFFGFFQFFMTILGWGLSNKFKLYIERYDHWIAFILLSIIGIKMIKESLENDDGMSDKNPLNIKVLVILAIATSIDALVVGISFAFLSVDILFSSLLIGVVALVLSLGGVFLGKKFGEILNSKAEIFGGAVLILIGTKILLEHTGII